MLGQSNPPGSGPERLVGICDDAGDGDAFDAAGVASGAGSTIAVRPSTPTTRTAAPRSSGRSSAVRADHSSPAARIEPRGINGRWTTATVPTGTALGCAPAGGGIRRIRITAAAIRTANTAPVAAATRISGRPTRTSGTIVPGWV